MKQNDIISRRGFFKKAATMSLSVISAVAVASIPTMAHASSECEQCRGICTGCMGGCTGSCAGHCKDTCTGGCEKCALLF